MDELTRRAAHLMWLERQIRLHRRWQGWLIFGWGMTAAGIALLFGLFLPLLKHIVALPDEVNTVLLVGVSVEILTLVYMTGRIIRRRITLEHEIDELTQ